MELLAPAGNLQKLKCAVLYGADAVYLSGPKFGLRSASDNFTDAELEESVEFAHTHGRKIYVTLNAFLHEADMKELPEYIGFLDEQGVDAVIVSDLGVMSVVHEHSSIPLHLSTQASCLNSSSATFWKEIGVQRIILGREVSIADAARIRALTGVEVEMFVHGSMCMAYSGNCTISNYTSGRDSNRGGCVQSCRFTYDIDAGKDGAIENRDASFMSSKDLRGMRLLPQFMEAGVESIKIEGRMKSSLYVATTVQAYSKGLRILREKPEKEWPEALEILGRMLEKIPHRDYTEASLEEAAGKESIYYGNRDGRGISSYEMAGSVMEVKNGDYLALLVHNPFETGQELEVLRFDGTSAPLRVHEMREISGSSISRALPNRLVLLPAPEGTAPLNIVRRKLV